MNIALRDDLQQLLRSKVENGQFPSEEAVVQEALRRFLVDGGLEGSFRSGLAAEPVEDRAPGPFIEDRTALPPIDLPRDSHEIGCSYFPNATREPNTFPGE
jgi:Arc/MetJ-type ribon-helix-helix transcriptional regulator